MDSPIGRLLVCTSSGGICHVEFGGYAERLEQIEAWLKKHWPGSGAIMADAAAGPSKLLDEAERQLHDYFEGRLRSFDLPLELRGTPFQKAVWGELARIPYGEVRSYKQIAELVGKPLAVRAVGGANNRNPVPLIIPCHRVIGANGAMVGFGGGVGIKTYLLGLEGSA
ncbi:methylated-DNA--[protein]-cysteine S-methyltransferase [Paenibacillus tarimensis]|nr:methylated-DNA--[protein]-cysteine S-methyltransferase [Paenibacillus tarimensis]MCF2946404.1 methylated-DNA--[protein]-cysteine S-methyltransferase [Paenibacillus tarimensis]